MNIVLVNPKIPHNTGTIGRLCVGANATLHLIEPLGFRLEDKFLKRAGLDYWQYLKLHIWDSLDDFWQKHPLCDNHFFLTTKADKSYFEADFKKDCFLYFGSEDAGLSNELLKYTKQCFKIPMHENARSLNLALSAGIVVYEALRQIKLSETL
ncbi:MAG: tRNA (cytidine(34)-2'-O)-methyltransferase [Helicobacter sp.]|nr:tRNA (cytidine(34)-2'-O)-methyltransferase [Helicobacter sp.]